jgi:hypothetical protein
MKPLPILLFSLFSFSSAVAQNCLPNGITFTTQSQIDNFHLNYPGCTQIIGDVEITGNNITNLNGLTSLASIEGGLFIYNNPLLTSLSGLNTLHNIGGMGLWMENNPGLTTLAGLGSLSTIGGLYIGESMPLTNLAGLSHVCLIYPRGVEIKNNQSLADLTGLDNVQSIGILSVSGSCLSSLNGLNSVTSLNGALEIIECPNLTDFSGLDQVESIGDYLYIESCPSLSHLTGLGKLASIGGKLYISGNQNLIDLNGLDSLKSIGGEVYIHACGHLNSLSALHNLTSIVGYLMVESNTHLQSLSGLDNIDYTTINGLRIYLNLNLCSCAVKSVCDYLHATTSNCEIFTNATGCGSVDEVMDSCLTLSTNDRNVNPALEVFPNPSSDRINIQLPGKLKTEYLSISNLFGQEIQKLLITDTLMYVEIGGLPDGLYLVKVQSGQEVYVGKFLKY